MVGTGLGAGVKDFRAVIIFKNPDAMHKFVNEGWEFGGRADVAAKSGETGGAAAGAVEATGDMEICNFTPKMASLFRQPLPARSTGKTRTKHEQW